MRGLEPGDPATVGRYRLLARLGAGGMAVVYLARSPARRTAAVKVMHADLAADPAYRERFRREVEATTAVAGRYCPAVLDAGPDAAVPWLATEFLPSVSLRDAVHDHGPLAVGAVWALAAGLAEALGSVHRAGIAHLDVKPANVLLTPDGPRLVDFGIAAVVGAVGSPAGSWGFMSPEQASVGVVGTASDVYSLGATLAFACTGARPGAAGVEQIADAGLRDLVARCLRPDARGRPTVADLLDRVPVPASSGLSAAVRADIDRRVGEARNPPVPDLPQAPSRRRVLLLAAAGLAVVAAGGAAVVALRPSASPRSVSPRSGSPSSAPSSAPAPSARTRSLEFYIFGRTTIRTLTFEVNGRVDTVGAATLPYRRAFTVPDTTEAPTWRFAFTATPGQYSYEVTLDGYTLRTGSGSAVGSDIDLTASSADR